MEPIDLKCPGCSTALGFDLTMAFQPIVDVRDGSAFAYEALVRGTDGAGAFSVLSKVTQQNRYAFDQTCRTTAVELASTLGLTSMLSINFMPNAIYEPRSCIRSTLQVCEATGFPTENIIFEFTEDEPIAPERLREILAEYKRQGFKTAIDDFGAGYAGLSLLADFQPDIVKIDMKLVRGIEGDRVRQKICSHVLALCTEIGCRVVAEGIETVEEMDTLEAMGVYWMQGYLFAKPGFQCLPEVRMPASARAA